MIYIKNVIDPIFTTIFVFISLLILSRMLGKKQLSQLTFFNYVAGISIGTLAGNSIDTNMFSTTDNFFALIYFCLLTVIAGYISLKIPMMRPLIEDQPTIVIKKGKIQQQALRKLNLNVDLLMMLLRKKNVFTITEVSYAILEPNGKLSVLKNEANKNVTKKDMNINYSNQHLIPSEIIVDGTLITNNLKELNITEEWLKKELNKQGVKNYHDVLYAEVTENKSLYIDKKELL